MEKLSMNAFSFTFPPGKSRFYFSDKRKQDSTELSQESFPNDIKLIFPNISGREKVYTSFRRQSADMTPLEIDFKTENFCFLRKYYNWEIFNFYRTSGYIVEIDSNGDNTIWIHSKQEQERKQSRYYVFDRFSIKFKYSNLRQQPEIIITYDKPAKILKTPVNKLYTEYNDSRAKRLFEEGVETDAEERDLTTLINKVLLSEEGNQQTWCKRYSIWRYHKLLELSGSRKLIDFGHVFPIVDRELATYLGESSREEEDESDIAPNRYLRYIEKIKIFRDEFILRTDLQKIIPIRKEFMEINADQVKEESMRLEFGSDPIKEQRTIELMPQDGLYSGPFKSTGNKVSILVITPKGYECEANFLCDCLINGYESYPGLMHFLGVPFSIEKGLSITKENAVSKLTDYVKRRSIDDSTLYLAICLKHNGEGQENEERKILYNSIFQTLLDRKIVTQFVEIDNMIKTLESDTASGRDLFAKELQDKSVAINAKLGGTPWKNAEIRQPELVIGIGAFRHQETNTTYIGSAFSFNEIGKFSVCDYFKEGELAELAGSILEAAERFEDSYGTPKRIIIHYYKTIDDEIAESITSTIRDLNMPMPVYIVTINKKESDDVIIFDMNTSDLMPSSGRFAKIEDNVFLLCNNAKFNATSKVDAFPFPMKMKVSCANDTRPLANDTIRDLIEQVYQFSRVYWREVRQHNLPVSMQYTALIAGLAPYLTNGIEPDKVQRNGLWFL